MTKPVYRCRGALIVEGHTLIAEGAPHDDDGEYIRGYGMIRTSGPGRAKCSCGELSDVLPSVGPRRKWHVEHKEAVAAELPICEARIEGRTRVKIDTLTRRMRPAGEETRRRCEDLAVAKRLDIHGVEIDVCGRHAKHKHVVQHERA
jgi:hypothetical protein